jgi:quercetin dioxygenase-like cupin family protein
MRARPPKSSIPAADERSWQLNPELLRSHRGPVRRGVRRLAAILAAIVALAALNATALATPPSGQHASLLVTGSLAAPWTVNADRIKFQTKDDADIAMFTVTYDPAGYSGWHTHPGMLFVLVVSGSVNRVIGCTSTTYSAGQTFIESDEQPAGQVVNASSDTPAVLQVTQIVPKGSPRRAEADAPSC